MKCKILKYWRYVSTEYSINPASLIALTHIRGGPPLLAGFDITCQLPVCSMLLVVKTFGSKNYLAGASKRKHTMQNAIKRMQHELRMLEREPPHGISAWPKGDSLLELEASN